MTTETEIGGLGDFARWGFRLEHPDDHSVELHHQGEFVARFSQTGATAKTVQDECANHMYIKHGFPR